MHGVWRMSACTRGMLNAWASWRVFVCWRGGTGKVLHMQDLRRYKQIEAATGEVLAAPASHLRLVELERSSDLDHFVVSRYIVSDHLCKSLESNLEQLTAALEGDSEPDHLSSAGIGSDKLLQDVEDDMVGMYGGVDWRPRRVFH